MAELKTKKNEANVEKFLQGLADPQQREDSLRVMKLMKAVTRTEPKMWGSSIVGFGDYHYKSPSGREGDWFIAGFSPRKGNLTLYLMSGFARSGELLAKLGKHKTGKGCLYIKRLEDVDLGTLKQLVKRSIAHLKELVKESVAHMSKMNKA